MAKKDRFDQFVEDFPDKVAEVTDRVKATEAADVIFKGGVWASCVLGTKFFLDLIPLNDMFKWAQEHENVVQTAFKSYAFFQIGASPLAVAIPAIQNLYDESKDELKALVVEAGLFYEYAQDNKFNPFKVAEYILKKPDDMLLWIKGKMANKEAEANSLTNLYNQRDVLIAELNALGPHTEEWVNKRKQLDELNILIAQAEAAKKALQDAEAVAEEARKRAEALLKWGIALVLGTYLAGSMIYAQDTLLDSIGSAFKMLGLPFPVV